MLAGKETIRKHSRHMPFMEVVTAMMMPIMEFAACYVVLCLCSVMMGNPN